MPLRFARTRGAAPIVRRAVALTRLREGHRLGHARQTCGSRASSPLRNAPDPALDTLHYWRATFYVTGQAHTIVGGWACGQLGGTPDGLDSSRVLNDIWCREAAPFLCVLIAGSANEVPDDPIELVRVLHEHEMVATFALLEDLDF